MDQVFEFDKSFQQRLREYQDILGGFEILPASGLIKEWGFYLELSIDPNGWQAVWKISRLTCEELKIPFPTVVLVFVLNVDFSSLQAAVRVIAVQDDIIHIPEKHLVPLIQLWVTKTQDRSTALNVSSTANSIDMLRFFYTRLFLPWDLDDDDNIDWKSTHLESRLRLYYDMKNGVIPKAVAAQLNSLLSEARRLQTKKENVEMELEDVEINEKTNAENINMLTDIHLRLLEIKNEVEILENPLLRKALIKRQCYFSHNNSSDSKIWLINGSSKVGDHITFLEQVKLLYPNEEVSFQSSLSPVLENGGPSDVFILNSGKYKINEVGALENGGILKGIQDGTTLISNLEHIMFDFQVNDCFLENLTIDATLSQRAAVVRRGKVKFSNCKIFGDGNSTHQGIIVLAGGELELINCEISGFFIAVVGNSGSQITMKNTEIHNVHYGLKLYDNTTISMQKCAFRDCEDHGICVETENNQKGDRYKIGSFDILSIIPGVTSEFISGSNNKKGDVLINNSTQITAMEDLFSINDPTASGEPTDEEMITEEESDKEEFDVTVFEKRKASPATI